MQLKTGLQFILGGEKNLEMTEIVPTETFNLTQKQHKLINSRLFFRLWKTEYLIWKLFLNMKKTWYYVLSVDN